MNDWNEIKVPQSKYLKLKAGNTKLRIVAKPIVGYEAWIDEIDENGKVRQKAIRRPYSEGEYTKSELEELGTEKKSRYFISCLVYNYSIDTFQIWNITQASIYNTLVTLGKDEDWGSPLAYDLKINKKGEGLETQYLVTPGSKAPLNPQIQELCPFVDLNKLFINEDPFEV